jgi:hypothetical protein
VGPRRNLACTPAIYSREANRVWVDGAHTLQQVEERMALLRRERGPGQNAQSIGGEVTLLSPGEHAAALAAMRSRAQADEHVPSTAQVSVVVK